MVWSEGGHEIGGSVDRPMGKDHLERYANKIRSIAKKLGNGEK